jgi:type IV secretory pathway VirJ component
MMPLFFAFGLIAHTLLAPAELPVRYFAPSDQQKPLVVYVSGDGGWNQFTESMVNNWVNDGYGVVAIDAKKYFWKAKTPLEFGKDMAPIIEEKLKEWKLNRLIWVGFSFGADVSAFVPGKIPPLLATRMKHLVLISPSTSTDYEVKLLDMARIGRVERKYKVNAALEKISGISVLCIFGEEEEKEWITQLNNPAIRTITLPGDHYYNQQTDKVIDAVEAYIR